MRVRTREWSRTGSVRKQTAGGAESHGPPLAERRARGHREGEKGQRMETRDTHLGSCIHRGGNKAVMVLVESARSQVGSVGEG